MLQDALLVLGIMANYIEDGVGYGGGVGLSQVVEKTAMTRYLARKTLGLLASMGFVERKGNRYFRTAGGCMLVDADNKAWGDLLKKGKK